MLSDKSVIAVMPATNIERAKNFYGEKLELNVEATSAEELVVKAAGGTKLLLYKKPEGTKGEHTEATFSVENLEQEMRELRGRGVIFEEYDMPGLKTENGIATLGTAKAAWFKDSEGNILALHQAA